MLSPDDINVLNVRAGVINKIRELANHYLMPNKPVEEKDKGNPEYVRKMANAAAAVEVVCSLVNTFGVMLKLRNFSNEGAIADLVFVLNTNTFWVTNAAYLVPIMNSAINSFQDNSQLYLDNQPLWKNLEYHNRNCWLELLPAVVFCLRGYADMRKVSLEMKQAFEPLLGGLQNV